MSEVTTQKEKISNKTGIENQSAIPVLPILPPSKAELARINGQRGGLRAGAGRPINPVSKTTYMRMQADKVREVIMRKVKKNIIPIVDKAIEQAIKGDNNAREFLFDRSVGKARQNVGIDGGEDAKPIQVQISEIIAVKHSIQQQGEK